MAYNPVFLLLFIWGIGCISMFELLSCCHVMAVSTVSRTALQQLFKLQKLRSRSCSICTATWQQDSCMAGIRKKLSSPSFMSCAAENIRISSFSWTTAQIWSSTISGRVYEMNVCRQFVWLEDEVWVAGAMNLSSSFIWAFWLCLYSTIGCVGLSICHVSNCYSYIQKVRIIWTAND
jgi:hypothetical protein